MPTTKDTRIQTLIHTIRIHQQFIASQERLEEDLLLLPEREGLKRLVLIRKIDYLDQQIRKLKQEILMSGTWETITREL